jgi:AcrR family transcriptional regulator
MFLENGIDQVKMTDIADESGVGVATLYRYFGTKTGILIAAMTYMWGDLKVMFSGVFESDIFSSQSGIKQINDLMRMYIVLFTAHKDFMRLLAEFDVFIRREGVSKSELEDYDRSIINFYPVFENAYKTGLADGTVREVENFPMLYLTYAHSLMELSKKLVQGEITPSDNFNNAEAELNLLIDTAVYYFRKE